MTATTPPKPDRAFPRLPLLGAAALLAVAMSATLAGRLAGPAPAADPGQPLVVRELRFADRADGGVAVEDAQDGRIVAALEPGQDGFIRATMRGLARERRAGSAGAEAPFRLAAWPDGRLSLTDLATGRSIDINAFGITQVQSFARLLHAQPRHAEAAAR